MVKQVAQIFYVQCKFVKEKKSTLRPNPMTVEVDFDGYLLKILKDRPDSDNTTYLNSSQISKQQILSSLFN